MDISRRLSNEDTATSMYLSFDAESTMGTNCYKTMEAMSDISAMSALSIMEEETTNMDEKSEDNKHMNSTLEAPNDSSLKSPVKTVKKLEIVTTNTPLRALPKNILKEYKALCSTPSKEQLMKTVDVTRGSDAIRCIDLGLAFLGVDDENPAYFPPPAEQCEDNKENAMPESEEGSTLSASSSVEITTSVIERKMLSSMSTVGSITEEESIEEMIVEEIIISKQSVETTPKANKENVGLVLETKVDAECPKNGVETTPKAKTDNIGNMETITEVTEDTPKIKEIEVNKKMIGSKSSGKPKIAILSSRTTRRSLCEPNLLTNKPSRIINSGLKRQSLLPTSRKSSTHFDAETEIPLLMRKMLKISNETSMQVEEVAKNKEESVKEPLKDNVAKNNEESLKDNVTNNKEVSVKEPIKKQGLPTEKRRSLMTAMKTRSSLLPSAAGEKRPFSFTQRMSVVVKTTLNSPARKIARRSTMVTSMASLQRRSMMPTKTVTEATKAPQNLLVTRRSMLPKTTGGIPMNSKTITTTLKSFKETTSENKIQYPLTKMAESSKIRPPSVGLSYNKPDASFTCNVCKEKFRVKSLLDAHKRGHEKDNIAPAFIKKPTTTSSVSSNSSGGSLSGGSSNQCKYCDKKFALVRALHIHLLQNCSKIPPADKRKLQYTDLNHVEKAQLPNIFSHHQKHNSASSTVSSTMTTPRNVVKQNTNNINVPKTSTESLSENKDVPKTTMDFLNVGGSNMSAPNGSVQKTKKHAAHAGVYRTPSKSVPCHLCKLTFKSILDYTTHSLTVHGNNKTHQNLDKGNEDA